jgi:hypothetical protein
MPYQKQRYPGSVHARLQSAATALSDAASSAGSPGSPQPSGRPPWSWSRTWPSSTRAGSSSAKATPPLFTYCTAALHLAEHAADNRIEVARASREFPAILDLLVDGSLNLATAGRLAPHLRPDNFDAVVAMARGKSKREVEVLVARLAPRPDVPSSVRRLPDPVPPMARAAVAVSSHETVAISPDQEPNTTPPQPDACAPPLLPGAPVAGTSGNGTAATLDTPPFPREGFVGRPAGRPVVAPLAPARYRVQFTIGEETHRKLRRVQDLLRREIPDGDPGRSSTAR